MDTTTASAAVAPANRVFSDSAAKEPQWLYTPLGRGKIVYNLPDGTFVVQFAWGGGRIYHPSELRMESILRDLDGNL